MSARNPSLDHLKAIACLTIVLHHLAFYGPMADIVRPAWPALVDWLHQYGRMAVQVFLVLGGYLACAALAPQGTARHTQWWQPLSQRFIRLCLPYSAALIVALVVNEAVRAMGFEHRSVSDTATWDSLLAHLLLLHSIGGWESISAGVWYVAIDFQLYALCLLWLWLCSRQTVWSGLGQAGVVVGTAASLWWWNLDSSLDIWALYFLGAYGLGMMAWWATHAPQRTHRALWIIAIAVLGCVALGVAWRDRIALALASALLLAVAGNVNWPEALRQWQCQPLAWTGQRSYSIFLIHFPMCLLVSACISAIWPASLLANAAGIVLAVALSLAAGAVLYALTERRKLTGPQFFRWPLATLATGMGTMLVAEF